MRTTTGLIRRLFGKSRRSDFFGDTHDIAFAEDRFRRAVGYVLCCVVFVLVSLAMGLNWIEGNVAMLLPLGGVILSVLCSFGWLWIFEDAVYGPLYLLISALAALGVYLLLVQSSPYASLFWFLLFPPMVMMCLGIRRSLVIFVLFFSFLIVVMATPLQTHVSETLNHGIRMRFLLAMLGAFAFSWCTEFLRLQTQFALGRTMVRLEQDSLTDPLTGLGNRRDFYNHCKWIMDNNPGTASVFSLAIADIDHFKTINDTHGHEIGDKVLQHVTMLLGSQMRGSDRLYRWGGEEFLVLMPNTDARDARQALERMRATVEETPYSRGGLTIPFTISIGLYSGNMRADPTAQIGKADQNLYAAKSSGRNKVVG